MSRHGSENRQRQHQIATRLNDDELVALIGYTEANELTIGEAVRDLVLKGVSHGKEQRSAHH